jgi:hypothetical protein
MINFLRIQQQKKVLGRLKQKRRVTLFGKITAQPRVLPLDPSRRSIATSLGSNTNEKRKSKFSTRPSNIGRPSVFMQAIQEN